MAPDEAKAEGAGKRGKKKRLGLIIRLAIYLPLLGFFGWRAAVRFGEGREAADAGFRQSVSHWLHNPPGVIMLPNGEAMPLVELGPDQAKALGIDPEAETDDPAETGPAPEPEPEAATEGEAPEPEPESATEGEAPGDTGEAPE